jgi:hypothetical protein
MILFAIMGMAIFRALGVSAHRALIQEGAVASEAMAASTKDVVDAKTFVEIW